MERIYIGLLLNNPKAIVKYYFLYDDCYFEDPEMLNIYKSILFTEAGSYTPEIAKKRFNFAKITESVQKLKATLKANVQGKNYSTEKTYVELKKLFVLRKKLFRDSN